MLAKFFCAAPAARGLARRSRNCHDLVTGVLLAGSLLLCARTADAQGRLAAPVRDTTLVALDDDGLRLHSPDGRRQLKLRGFVLIDGRYVPSDRTDQLPNGFAIRLSRLIIDLNVNPWVAFRMMPDLYVNGGTPAMADAFVDMYFSKRWWLRVGKQKTAFGWERLQSETDMAFAERSIASMLGSNRDLGAVLTADLDNGRGEVAVGLFNGVADGGANGDGDGNDAKDLEARVLLRPVMRPGGQGWTVGAAATHGIMRAAGTNSGLPRFSTVAGSPFFTYREAAGSIADGERDRFDAFTFVHFGTMGFYGEAYRDQQMVRRTTTLARVTTTGYIGTVDWVLTGEKSIQGGVTPARPFDPDKGQWGAFQLAARVAHVGIGDQAFPALADSAVAARSATELGVDLNWHITRLTKAQLEYTNTSFRAGAATGNRAAEQFALLRLQLFF